jgi:anaerobic nitric oxide reductase flavorubredoxin
MERVELKPDIFWVGVVDWAIRDFHGYITPRGSTYNSYLIMDDDITLLDGVKLNHADTQIKRVSRYVDMAKIKNIVVNHIEPDHSGSLGHLAKLCPNATFYITDKGKKGLSRFFDISGWNMKVVKTGDTLNTGKRTLRFVETPMIHWPDSMMTFSEEDKILFSQDGFGQHLASAQRFDDEFTQCSSWAELEDAVWDYYANILMPFGTLIKRKIDELGTLGVAPEMIAPVHGIIWRKEPGWVLNKYLEMAEGKTDERVVVIYDTMWFSTEKIAHAVVEGLRDEGMDVRVLSLKANPTSVAIKEFWHARGCLIGSPTLNNNLLPTVGKFLTYLKGLRPKNRMVGAFGSFGWAGGAVKQILQTTKDIGLETVEEGYQFNYRASGEDEGAAFEYGKSFAQKVKEYHKKF